MRLAKIIVPAAILAGGLVVCSTQSYAKPEYTKKEKKACTVCHTKSGSKDLNDAGKYYKDHNNSLDGYEKKS